MKQKIAVIGAGVIGLSVARELALQGAEVTLLDAGRVGTGTSRTTYAWVNSNGKSPMSYHQLNAEGMREHRRLQQQSSSEVRWLDESGTIEWASEPAKAERLYKRVESLKIKTYPVALLDRQDLALRIPELVLPHESVQIWHFPSESLLCPSLFMAFLRSEVVRYGASIVEHQQVTAIDEHAHGVSLELNNDTYWEGDLVVSAVGRWSGPLLAKLGLELAMVDADQPGRIGCSFLGYTSAAQVQLRSNLITPEINIRPDGGGRLLLQVPDIDHLADPAQEVTPDSIVGREMMTRLARVIRNIEGVMLERIAVGQRSRPADGLPALGFVTDRKRVYFIATHSGMTLSPVLGRLVTEELLKNERSALLVDFGPERLLGKKANEFQIIETIHFPTAQ